MFRNKRSGDKMEMAGKMKREREMIMDWGDMGPNSWGDRRAVRDSVEQVRPM